MPKTIFMRNLPRDFRGSRPDRRGYTALVFFPNTVLPKVGQTVAEKFGIKDDEVLVIRNLVSAGLTTDWQFHRFRCRQLDIPVGEDFIAYAMERLTPLTRKEKQSVFDNTAFAAVAFNNRLERDYEYRDYAQDIGETEAADCNMFFFTDSEIFEAVREVCYFAANYELGKGGEVFDIYHGNFARRSNGDFVWFDPAVKYEASNHNR